MRELTYEPEARAYEAGADLDRLASAVGAFPADTPAGRCLRIDRRYESDRWHGDVRVGECEPPDLSALEVLCGAVVAQPFRAARGLAPRAFFLDIETTGLSSGAGTVAFLVGCGYFDFGAFQVHQFLLPSYAAERALLAAVADAVAPADCIVTYNGKTFDLPVMETRWLFHRMAMPLAEIPHVDMLPPARRLWRQRVEAPEDRGLRIDNAGCNLGLLERDLFGVRRVGDVPGFEIPSRFFRFLRSGDPSPLEAVLEHNRLDLISLAAVTARALALARGGSAACRDGRERLALGRLLERAGRDEEAVTCYREASADVEAGVRADALCRLALRLRGARQYAEAAEAWQQVLTLDEDPAARIAAPAARLAREALAVHKEHRARDLDGARDLALAVLGDLESAGGSPGRRDALRYRLARLDRKLAGARKDGSAPLPGL